VSTADTDAAVLVIHAVRIVRGRPPSARLLLDIELANLANEARWALLPGQLPPDEGGVFAVETLEAAGPPPVVLARILGRGGRLAVRLAPGARVRLHDVGLTWWGPSPERVELTVELVAAVRVGERGLEAWLEGDPGAVADGTDVTLAGALTLESRMTEGLVAVPLELDGAIERATAGFEVLSDR